ncbi:hypothetical protein JY651_37265 [Pyxidicoccus parkwayensis]|uniref:NIPSNAP family protein n=1 Tax=Pyxidicoccus parkwayensis TaxID=2813578 RepID=A0ABX7NPQ9_9BACT|nr:hypothetical protein [Pyxidicoccus parkwaysis]QSQ20837.1 hypothetical protein JY651_37265 [Pyxidicoccus parkwaysis]
MSPTEPARFLLLNYMKLEAQQVPGVAELLSRPRPTDARFPRSLYKHEAGDRLLEFVGFQELSGLGELLADGFWRETEGLVRPRLAMDFRRQLHGLRDVVKPSASSVPGAERLQLSRGEIAPRALDEYHAWRRDTLFPHVRSLEPVEGFAAYHSVMSTEPGFLFLAGYSGPAEKFQETQKTPAWQELTGHAASRYILGAVATSHWTRV